MMKLIARSASLILFFILILSNPVSAQTHVWLVPTLHRLHQTNNNYNYDSLKLLVARLDPDLIAVEIRKEDIAADTAYLRKNYPLEMRMMRSWFPHVAVEGFDWLGNDIKGKPIPANYWTEIAAIKKQERALERDSIYSNKTHACEEFSRERLQLLQTLSLKDLLSSRDSLLTMQYYQCLDHALRGSAHARVLKFYEKRNKKILKNIKAIIRRNKGRKIVILTGDDHFIYLKDKIRHRSFY